MLKCVHNKMKKINISKIDIPIVKPSPDSDFSHIMKNGKLDSFKIGGQTYKVRLLRKEDSMQNRGIFIDMYLIEGTDVLNYDKNIDLADIIVLERTPIQYFSSKRVFMEVPVAGEAYFLAQAPDKKVYQGYWNAIRNRNNVIFLGENWIFTWIVPEGKRFRFFELCNPRFIDETEDIPIGEKSVPEIKDIQNSNLLTLDYRRALYKLLGYPEF